MGLGKAQRRAAKEVPLSELYALLDHYFKNEQWLRTKPDGWAEGGVMPFIRRGMLLTAEGQEGRWIAHGMVANQLARGIRAATKPQISMKCNHRELITCSRCPLSSHSLSFVPMRSLVFSYHSNGKYHLLLVLRFPGWLLSERPLPSRRGTKLSFVYDFVTGSADFTSLKYTLDAARKPLRDLDDDDFAALYGISRRLRFKLAAPRKPWQHDVWTDIYG